MVVEGVVEHRAVARGGTLVNALIVAEEVRMVGVVIIIQITDPAEETRVPYHPGPPPWGGRGRGGWDRDNYWGGGYDRPRY